MRYFILSLSFALAACATTEMPDNRGILVDTQSAGQVVTGASCIVSTNNGSWNVTTPGHVMVGNVNGDLRAVCDKSGYRTSEVIFKPSRYGNFSNAGVGIGAAGGSGNVGFGIGFSLPIGTGRGGYPLRITVEMHPQ